MIAQLVPGAGTKGRVVVVICACVDGGIVDGAGVATGDGVVVGSGVDSGVGAGAGVVVGNDNSLTINAADRVPIPIL